MSQEKAFRRRHPRQRSRIRQTPLHVERLEPRTLLASAVLGDYQLLIVAGDPNGDPPDSPDNRIDPNTANSPFAGVGSLEIRGRTGVGGCSGTAITPRHVLTAAHCVDWNLNGKVDPGGDPFEVIFHLNLDTDTPADETDVNIASTNWFLHPDISFHAVGGGGFHDDLAVVELSASLPAGVPFYELYRGDVLGQTITMVGYGDSGDGLSGFYISGSPTVKRVGFNVVDVVQGQDDSEAPEANELWRADFDHPTDTSLNLFGGPSLGNDLEATIGFGDSGGPAFVLVGTNSKKASSYQIAGVNTHVGAGLTSFFHFGSTVNGMIVPAYVDWIHSILAAGGSAPASGGSAAAGISGSGLRLSSNFASGIAADAAIAAFVEWPSAAVRPVLTPASERARIALVLPTPLRPLDLDAVDRFFTAAKREEQLSPTKRSESKEGVVGHDERWLTDWTLFPQSDV